MEGYVKAILWGAVAGLALIGTTPASAVDLNGRIVVIDGVWHPYGGGQPYSTQITIRGVSGLLQWSGIAQICEVNGSQIDISLLYGPEANRTGQIACDPMRRG